MAHVKGPWLGALKDFELDSLQFGFWSLGFGV